MHEADKPNAVVDLLDADGLTGQSIARLQQGTSAAATTLLKVMIDPNAPASVRVRAADSVLNHASKAIEIEDIEARLSELERATEASRQMKNTK